MKTIVVKQMDTESCKWHKVAEGSHELRTSDHTGFPTGDLMGVINKRYADTHGIGANIGCNLGSGGLAVMDVDAAVRMLNEAGHTVVFKS